MNPHYINMSHSSDIVAECLYYALNTIPYMRGIFSVNDFDYVVRYKASIFLTNDNGLREYILSILNVVRDNLPRGQVHKIAMEIVGEASKIVHERWEFSINLERPCTNRSKLRYRISSKPLAKIQQEFRRMMRAIYDCAPYLPNIREHSFINIRVYMDKKARQNANWMLVHPREFNNAFTRFLKPMATGIQYINPSVTFSYP